MQSLATGRITARATATATGQFHLTVRFSKHRNMFLVHLKHVGLKSDSNSNSNSNTISRSNSNCNSNSDSNCNSNSNRNYSDYSNSTKT